MNWMFRIWLVGMFIVFTGLGLLLGSIWAKEDQRPKLVIEQVPASSNKPVKRNTSEKQSNKGNFVASRNGEKYYPRGCGAVDRIHKENRIYFATEQQAQNSGRERTELCN